MVMTGLLEGKNESEILLEIRQKYNKVNFVKEEEMVGADFNSNRKSETYISTALKSVVRCGICGGVVHINSTSVDHVERKREGGLGTAANGQITHPYCNTGYKH